jgi:hypothetical protein
VGVGSQRVRNRLKHAGAIPQNVVVPKAKNAPALAYQHGVPPPILGGDSMLAAIGFYNQANLNTGKIDDIGWDRKLTSEASAKLTLAQVAP